LLRERDSGGPECLRHRGATLQPRLVEIAGTTRGCSAASWASASPTSCGIIRCAILKHGSHLAGIEIKSGQTVAPDFFSSLEHVGALLATTSPRVPLHPVVVYGGDRPERRTAGRVVPWADAHTVSTDTA
jgi:hypothetical protein